MFDTLFQKYDQLIFFDTETTGFDGKNDRIIELAAIQIKQNPQTEIVRTGCFDEFIQLTDRELPERVTEITGILPIMLQSQGLPEKDVVGKFGEMIAAEKRTLLIAHNAQFDLNFIGHTFIRYAVKHPDYLRTFSICDYLDTLTVYKDRAMYPHRLESAILHYELQDKVQNSHRAIDDTEALLAVTMAMYEERPDLLEYVNIFGYKGKYGISGNTLKKVQYAAQGDLWKMANPDSIFPRRIADEEHRISAASGRGG